MFRTLLSIRLWVVKADSTLIQSIKASNFGPDSQVDITVYFIS